MSELLDDLVVSKVPDAETHEIRQTTVARSRDEPSQWLELNGVQRCVVPILGDQRILTFATKAQCQNDYVGVKRFLGLSFARDGELQAAVGTVVGQPEKLRPHEFRRTHRLGAR